MKHMIRPIVGFLVSAALMLTLGACGSDESGDNSGTTSCPEGQIYNPILNRCVEPTDNPNIRVDNNQANNTPDNDTPNNDPQNNTPDNNTTGANNTTNNGTNASTNNGTNASTNNMTTPDLPCGTGNILGKTCAPSGEPLAAADVTLTGIDCATNMPFTMTTRTGSDGSFEFMDIPAGFHDLEISTGSFNSQSMVLVQKDQTTDLTSAAAKICLDQSVEIAVVEGDYDHVEGVLGTLNLDYDLISSFDATTFLTDLNAMNQYDIIFINCGQLYALTVLTDFLGTIIPQIAANLRAYVQGGKSIYTSDWAAPFLEDAFPEVVDFLGDDTDFQAARQGFAPQTIQADVLTPELQGVLGRATATIEFPHMPPQVLNDHWAIAEGVGINTTIQIQGDAVQCGNDANCAMMGDTVVDAPLLITYQDPSGGTAVYTSFHNERQSALNQDMEAILRYLIFQL